MGSTDRLYATATDKVYARECLEALYWVHLFPNPATAPSSLLLMSHIVDRLKDIHILLISVVSQCFQNFSDLQNFAFEKIRDNQIDDSKDLELICYRFTARYPGIWRMSNIYDEWIKAIV
jgi:hypothetical protein